MLSWVEIIVIISVRLLFFGLLLSKFNKIDCVCFKLFIFFVVIKVCVSVMWLVELDGVKFIVLLIVLMVCIFWLIFSINLLKYIYFVLFLGFFFKCWCIVRVRLVMFCWVRLFVLLLVSCWFNLGNVLMVWFVWVIWFIWFICVYIIIL